MPSATALDISRPRVLIVFPGALGDLICFLPAMRALARRHPEAAVELMARGELARFAAGRLGVERGHAIDRPEVSLLFGEAEDAAARASRFFGGFARVYSFFGAENATFRRVMANACAGPVSFHPFRPIIHDESGGHVSSAYLRSLDEAERAEPSGARVTLGAEDLEAARQILARCRIEPGNFILLMPGSGSRTKNWPAEKFAELGRLLPPHRPAAIILGPAEAELSGFFLEQRFPVLQNLELGEAAAVARMASSFVGNDSGMSHLAAAVGTPGVVLFGPTDPARWRPLGEIKVIARTPIDDITSAEVASAVKDLEAIPHHRG
ncbi:MAG: glycosyltransferase family 9 protein [Candidatus Binataceae bacterium]|jgi:ADP-heptose:LPS heptosyltransferase